jgi:PAS domain S-box-containing protein
MAKGPKSHEELLARLVAAHVQQPAKPGDPARPDEGLARLHHALEHMRAVMVEVGPDGRNLYVSPGLTTLLGYDTAEVLGQVGWGFVHEDDYAALVEMTRNLHRTGEPVTAVFRSRHKRGHWVWIEATATLFAGPEGGLRTVTFARDVSDVKAAGEALRASEDRLRTIAAHASDLIIEVDEHGRFLYVSDNVHHILGRRPEELVGHSVGEFAATGRIHPDDREQMMKGFVETIRQDRRAGKREARLQHADGSWHWFESRFGTYRSRDGEWRAVVIARDVTERRRAEEELSESEERYRLITDTAREMITEADDEGRILYVSPAIEQVLGYRPEEIIGTTPIALAHPDDVERVVEDFLEAVGTREPMQLEPYRTLHKDGSPRWLETEGITYHRADGERRFLMVSRDISERRRAEEERHALEERMQQAQRLEGLGVMAGGIAHDFNNLLTPILGDASLALLDLPEDSPARARIQKILTAGRRAAALTHQMLAYAGKRPLLVEALDLSPLVRDITQLLESSVAQRAELVYELGEGLPAIEGDAAQLSQVVMNLITNAAEAIGASGGRIAIRSGMLETLSGTQASRLGEELPEGPAVYFEVEDDGCGMDAETSARIFDPFFTTKFTGRGLGLAAALGIVRGHGGAIEIESAPDDGTRFRVIFPPAAQAAQTVAETHEDAASWRGSGTVLVIDDDEGVRDLVQETLERAELRVLCAADAPSGVELYAKHAQQIRVVILDRTMPATSGEEAFDAIRRVRSDARIVLVSGYSEEQAASGLSSRGLSGFLQKPFLPETLLEAVRRLIDD